METPGVGWGRTEQGKPLAETGPTINRHLLWPCCPAGKRSPAWGWSALLHPELDQGTTLSPFKRWDNPQATTSTLPSLLGADESPGLEKNTQISSQPFQVLWDMAGPSPEPIEHFQQTWTAVDHSFEPLNDLFSIKEPSAPQWEVKQGWSSCMCSPIPSYPIPTHPPRLTLSSWSSPLARPSQDWWRKISPLWSQPSPPFSAAGAQRTPPHLCSSHG